MFLSAHDKVVVGIMLDNAKNDYSVGRIWYRSSYLFFSLFRTLHFGVRFNMNSRITWPSRLLVRLLNITARNMKEKTRETLPLRNVVGNEFYSKFEFTKRAPEANRTFGDV